MRHSRRSKISVVRAESVNLPFVVTFCTKRPYMLLNYIDVTDGLVNGIAVQPCTLLQQLRDKDILACGTFRTNRKNLPAELKVNNKLNCGEFVWKRKRNVTTYQWRDTKQVHRMPNYHNPSEDVQVDRATPKGRQKPVICPSAVRDYTRWMGGVDRFDQRKKCISAGQVLKEVVESKFLFNLDAAIVNAFIQHSYRNSIAYLLFRVMLGRQLISGEASVRVGTA
ncbi:hypothetical protein MRX96_008988 [Rhipicephalus microplus]